MAQTTAFNKARAEGLRYFWAHLHVGGCWKFLGNSWEDQGFSVGTDGNPVRDNKGNTVAKFSVEALDAHNPTHVAACEEWCEE